MSSSTVRTTVVEVLLLHVGVLRSQGWYGDLVEEELSLVWTDGRVKLIDRLTPVVLLTQLLQNLGVKEAAFRAM